MSANDTGPKHYTGKSIQPWAAMESWLSAEQFKGFLRGNAIKYLARCDDKGGVEDLRKARHYIDKLIELSTKVNPSCVSASPPSAATVEMTTRAWCAQPRAVGPDLTAKPLHSVWGLPVFK